MIVENASGGYHEVCQIPHRIIGSLIDRVGYWTIFQSTTNRLIIRTFLTRYFRMD